MVNNQPTTGPRAASRIWRLSRRLTLRDMAQQMGVGKSTLANLESTDLPVSRRTAEAIERVTGGEIKADSFLEVA